MKTPAANVSAEVKDGQTDEPRSAEGRGGQSVSRKAAAKVRTGLTDLKSKL